MVIEVIVVLFIVMWELRDFSVVVVVNILNGFIFIKDMWFFFFEI